MREKIENKQFDEERALYNLTRGDVIGCKFEGPADGESALKEARDIGVYNTSFSLRYPLWHVNKFVLEGSSMDQNTRAAIWYCTEGKIQNSKLFGIKAVRECRDISVADCEIESDEFGWKSENIGLKDSAVTSSYLFFDSKNITLQNVKMKGKYSFQYVDGLKISNSFLDTKDAFWHSKNIVVENSVVKGEYLAWFSENLTLINCTVIGTQPLCYCKGLRLINCKMQDTDLSFEYSEVDADIDGHIVSVKNPLSGRIAADSIGQVIDQDSIMECKAEIIIK